MREAKTKRNIGAYCVFQGWSVAVLGWAVGNFFYVHIFSFA